MPALVCDRCVVLHTPKTGGVWLMDAVRRHAVVRAEISAPGGWGHPTLAEVRVLTDRPAIAAVRRPSAWLRSFWGFMLPRNWDGSKLGPPPILAPLLQLGADDLHEFARRYLAQCPGYITTVLRAYVDGAEHVCRQEQLSADICAAFAACGEPLADPTAFCQLPRQNVMVPTEDLTAAEVRAIDAADRWVLDRYYPDEAATCV